MRRAGSNPTEVEVHDILNKIDDGSGDITFEDFCSVLHDKESFRTRLNEIKYSFCLTITLTDILDAKLGVDF